MIDKKTKVKVGLPDGDTDFFDIVLGVLQGDILTVYWLINYQNKVLRASIDLMKENSLTLEKSSVRT